MNHETSCAHVHEASKVFVLDSGFAEQASGTPQRPRSVGRLAFGMFVAGLVLLSSCPAWSKQVFFPAPKPTVIPLDAASQPGWRKNGTGDDGYVKIEVVSSMKNGCVPLGSAGILKIIATEEMQLTVSIKLTIFPLHSKDEKFLLQYLTADPTPEDVCRLQFSIAG